MKYDYIIVGSGLFGACFAHKAKNRGKKVLVLEKKDNLGGNLYCEDISGVTVHKFGAHIFHTSDKNIWNFVNDIVPFNNFINEPLAYYKGDIYNLPFNMNTFYKMWGTKTPAEAKEKIDIQRKEVLDNMYRLNIKEPRNLEEQALLLVGKDIYEILIKGYTEKQWGRIARELPPFIIKRLPCRFNYNNNYFNDIYQGVPIGGYNKLILGLLNGVEVMTNVDFLQDKDYFLRQGLKIIYTGRIDEFYNYIYGRLDYRSLRFEEEILDVDNYQGNAVVNYTDKSVPFTRIIEHKHFEFGIQPKTVITKEYPCEWSIEKDAFYPINDKENNYKYEKYKKLSLREKSYIFGGRLGEYKYYDMDQIISRVLYDIKID